MRKMVLGKKIIMEQLMNKMKKINQMNNPDNTLVFFVRAEICLENLKKEKIILQSVHQKIS